MDITEQVKKVAIALCKQDRYSSDARLKAADGFSVPMWLIYVSRAKQIVAERDALAK